MINGLKDCASKFMILIYLCVGIVGWGYFLIISSQYKFEFQIAITYFIVFWVISFIITTINMMCTEMCTENRKSTTFWKFIKQFLFVVPAKMLILLGVFFTIIYFKTDGTLAHEIGLWITLIVPVVLFLVTWVLNEIHDYKQELM